MKDLVCVKSKFLCHFLFMKTVGFIMMFDLIIVTFSWFTRNQSWYQLTVILFTLGNVCPVIDATSTTIPWDILWVHLDRTMQTSTRFYAPSDILSISYQLLDEIKKRKIFLVNVGFYSIYSHKLLYKFFFFFFNRTNLVKSIVWYDFLLKFVFFLWTLLSDHHWLS